MHVTLKNLYRISAMSSCFQSLDNTFFGGILGVFFRGVQQKLKDGFIHLLDKSVIKKLDKCQKDDHERSFTHKLK